MKVKIGNSVKNIPKQYSDGVVLVEESQLEAPLRIRLTPFERFLFAEAAWRKGLDNFTKEHLDGFKPDFGILQINRSGEKRYSVHYTKDFMGAISIVPKGVYTKCPEDIRVKHHIDF